MRRGTKKPKDTKPIPSGVAIKRAPGNISSMPANITN